MRPDFDDPNGYLSVYFRTDKDLSQMPDQFSVPLIEVFNCRFPDQQGYRPIRTSIFSVPASDSVGSEGNYHFRALIPVTFEAIKQHIDKEYGRRDRAKPPPEDLSDIRYPRLFLREQVFEEGMCMGLFAFVKKMHAGMESNAIQMPDKYISDYIIFP